MFSAVMRNLIKVFYRYIRYVLGFISQLIPIGSLFYAIEESPSLEEASNKKKKVVNIIAY